MRLASIVGLALVAAVHPEPVVAQQFEGIITARNVTSRRSIEQVLQVKGSRWRMDGGEGRAGGTLLSDRPGRLISIIDNRKSYLVLADGSDASAASDYMPKSFDATGRTDKVAGYSCQVYRTTLKNGEVLDECITSEFGFVSYAPGAGAGLESPVIAQKFPKGFMVLRVVKGDKTTYEVEKVERKSLPASTFEVPAGYAEVKMPGRGGMVPKP